MQFTARRLVQEPIIHPGMSDRIGHNINGPSLIRVPDWIENPLGRYYLYFAHHMGRYIRLAYSDNLLGPWTIHEPGVLDVAQSGFVTEDLQAGDLATDRDDPNRNGPLFLYAHIASPDVHIDDETRQIRMYFHGLLADADQQTQCALSDDGLRYRVLPPLLGPSYFRVFEHDAHVYAISWGGQLWRASHRDGPFEKGPTLLEGLPMVPKGMTLRHAATLRRGDDLELFYSLIGATPEVIMHARVSLDPDWAKWQVTSPRPVLVPSEPWEGSTLPVQTSAIGASDGPEHALRDPCVFTEEENVYLLYSGAGESGIGLAALIPGAAA